MKSKIWLHLLYAIFILCLAIVAFLQSTFLFCRHSTSEFTEHLDIVRMLDVETAPDWAGSV